MNAKDLMNGGRYGWEDRWRPRYYKYKAYEEAPKQEKMYLGWRRHSHLRYNVLDSYLKSRVGDLWDEVYSDLCARFDHRSHEGYLAREMIGWLVGSAEHERHRSFHVDDEGILREKEVKIYERPKILPRFVCPMKNFLTCRIAKNGDKIWLRMIMEKITDSSAVQGRDNFIREKMPQRIWSRRPAATIEQYEEQAAEMRKEYIEAATKLYGSAIECVRFEAANKKDIRDIKLAGLEDGVRPIRGQ